MRKLVIPLSFLTLLSVTGLQLYSTFATASPPSINQPLTELISTDIPGWEMRELPIAETEELKEAVVETLNFDDHLSRIYTKGDTFIYLYIAYWKEGKMPIRLVQAHTPDICWVRNGWDLKSDQTSVNLNVGSVPLKPAESRIFEKDHQVQYVYYWHVIGRETYTARAVGNNAPFDIIRALFKFGFHQKAEQFFVRLSSNVPLDNKWQDIGFKTLQQDMANLCLVQTTIE